MMGDETNDTDDIGLINLRINKICMIGLINNTNK